MATHNYNFQKDYDPKRLASASRANAPISTKYAVEFGNYFVGKRLSKAIKITTDIIEGRDHLPLVKYRLKVAHRKGIAKRGTPTGRFPIKTAEFIKKLLVNVQANAEDKNLDADKLKVIHMFAVKGVTRTKSQPQGRISGKQRESKSTNIEVIVLEE